MSFFDQPERAIFDPEEIIDPNRDLAAADTGFTGPDIETDTEAISQAVFNRLAALVDGWQAHDGNPDVWLIEAFSAIAAEIRLLAGEVPGAIFTTFGSEVLGLPIRVPAPAVGFATWVADDDRGYTIPIGTQITLARTGDELVGFEVLEGTVIPIGDTEAHRVPIRAIEPGVQGNGLEGRAEMSDPLDWVSSITVPNVTGGGDDGQDETEYLDTLSNLLRIMAFRPILPGDFALLALQVPGVGRAVAMDGYNPVSDSWGHVRTVTLITTDYDGRPLAGEVKERVATSLEDAREVNFVVNVVDANYEPVDVEFAVTAFFEQNPDTVRDICIDAIRQALEPVTYRLGTTSPGIEAGEVIPPPEEGRPPGRMTIRINDLIGLLDRCRGVQWVDWVTINGAVEDHRLGGATTLPEPGAIEGEVSLG